MTSELINEYNDFIDTETLNKEFKEFSFNQAGIRNGELDIKLAEHYCSTNLFEFNEDVINNLYKYFSIYVPRYTCAFLNANIDGELYIGVDDYGFVKGIPYMGKLPIKKLKKNILKTTRKKLENNFMAEINLEQIIEVNFIKINCSEKPETTMNPKFEKYLRHKNTFITRYNGFVEKTQAWRVRFDYFNQKLVDLTNYDETRQLLIAYVRKHDPTNQIISLLESDFKLEYRDHEEILVLKDDPGNVYHWVTRWKDEVLTKVRREKPKFTYQMSNRSAPINLITSVGSMVPWWMHNNDNMNLYVIHIKIKSSQLFLPDEINDIERYFKYYDLYLNKWCRCIRVLSKTGEPMCTRL